MNQTQKWVIGIITVVLLSAVAMSTVTVQDGLLQLGHNKINETGIYTPHLNTTSATIKDISGLTKLINTTGGQTIAGSLNFSDGSGMPELKINRTDLSGGGTQFNIEKPIRVAGLVYVDEEGLKFAKTVDIDADAGLIGIDVSQNSSAYAASFLQTSNTGAVNIQNEGTGDGVFINQDGDGNALEIDIDGDSPAIYVNHVGGTNSYGAQMLLPDTTNIVYLGKAKSDDKYGAYFYRNAPSSNTSNAVVRIAQDSTKDDQGCLDINNDGNGKALNIDQDGNASAIISSYGGSGLPSASNLYSANYFEVISGANARGVAIKMSVNQQALWIQNDGTSNSIYIDQNGNGVAVQIASDAAAPPFLLSQNKTPIVCNSGYAGGIYYGNGTDGKYRHYWCNGTGWNAMY